jgi:hypothetical protein
LEPLPDGGTAFFAVSGGVSDHFGVGADGCSVQHGAAGLCHDLAGQADVLVDILLRREDMERAKAALESVGFIHRRVASLGKAAAMDVFLDGPDAKVRDAIHILWAGEKAVPDAIESTPELGLTEVGDGFNLIPLEDLVRMKLISYRDKDRMHLRDLASVGLIDETWPTRFPATLAERLQGILDDPEG